MNSNLKALPLMTGIALSSSCIPPSNTPPPPPPRPKAPSSVHVEMGRRWFDEGESLPTSGCLDWGAGTIKTDIVAADLCAEKGEDVTRIRGTITLEFHRKFTAWRHEGWLGRATHDAYGFTHPCQCEGAINGGGVRAWVIPQIDNDCQEGGVCFKVENFATPIAVGLSEGKLSGLAPYKVDCDRIFYDSYPITSRAPSTTSLTIPVDETVNSRGRVLGLHTMRNSCHETGSEGYNCGESTDYHPPQSIEDYCQGFDFLTPLGVERCVEDERRRAQRYGLIDPFKIDELEDCPQDENL